MYDERLYGLAGAFMLGLAVSAGIFSYYSDSPDENQIKAFTQICSKYDVQVTGKDYRLSCDKGFIIVGSKGYLKANEILENKSKT